MNTIFRLIMWKYVLIFFDDVLVYSTASSNYCVWPTWVPRLDRVLPPLCTTLCYSHDTIDWIAASKCFCLDPRCHQRLWSFEKSHHVHTIIIVSTVWPALRDSNWHLSHRHRCCSTVNQSPNRIFQLASYLGPPSILSLHQGNVCNYRGDASLVVISPGSTLCHLHWSPKLAIPALPNYTNTRAV